MIIGNLINEIALSGFSLCIDAVMVIFSFAIVNLLDTVVNENFKMRDFEKLGYYMGLSIVSIVHSVLTLDRLIAILKMIFRHYNFLLEHSIVRDNYINIGYLVTSMLFAYGAYKIIKVVLDLSLRYYRAIKVS